MPPRSLIAILTAAAAGACATGGAVPRPFPVPGVAGVPSRAAERPPEKQNGYAGYALVGTALALRGTTYRPGGADPSGFDCSGFVYYVFSQHAIRVPRTVTEQWQAGKTVAPQDVAAGDLVFFRMAATGASHVGIAVGADEFVHAPSSRGEVRVERLSAPYWASRFVGARSVLER